MIRLLGPILVAAAVAPPLSLGQAADSLNRDLVTPTCAGREAANARPFEKTRPEVLVGRYEFTMASAWEEAAGRWSRGDLEIWRTLGGKVQGASDIDLDSLRVPGVTLDEPERDWYLDSGDLASRDTILPGLEYDSLRVDGGFLLAPVRMFDFAAMSMLAVDSLSDGGFWGRWNSDIGWSAYDEEGRILPNPHGTFCATRIPESEGAEAEAQRMSAFRLVPDVPLKVECDASYPDHCIPSPPPDLDCTDILERSFRVVGDDPHQLDRDDDGIACEGG